MQNLNNRGPTVKLHMDFQLLGFGTPTPHCSRVNCKRCGSGAIQAKVALVLGFPGGLMVKNPSANAGNASSIPGLGRSPGEEIGNPLQYSCLENSMDRGAWRATVHRVTQSQTCLSTHVQV